MSSVNVKVILTVTLLLLRHPFGVWNYIEQMMFIYETFSFSFSTQNSFVSYYTGQ